MRARQTPILDRLLAALKGAHGDAKSPALKGAMCEVLELLADAAIPAEPDRVRRLDETFRCTVETNPELSHQLKRERRLVELGILDGEGLTARRCIADLLDGAQNVMEVMAGGSAEVGLGLVLAAVIVFERFAPGVAEGDRLQ